MKKIFGVVFIVIATLASVAQAYTRDEVIAKQCEADNAKATTFAYSDPDNGNTGWVSQAATSADNAETSAMSKRSLAMADSHYNDSYANHNPLIDGIGSASDDLFGTSGGNQLVQGAESNTSSGNNTRSSAITDYSNGVTALNIGTPMALNQAYNHFENARIKFESATDYYEAAVTNYDSAVIKYDSAKAKYIQWKNVDPTHTLEHHPTTMP